MSNYLYGNCILTVEGDEVIYPVKPFNYEMKLEKDKAYLKDGFSYIYRGNITKKKKYKSGLFSDEKGNCFFYMDDDDKEKYSFDNIKDDSIVSIIKRANSISPKIQNKIMKDINKSTDIYLPDIDENDDVFKRLIKMILLEKKISLKDYKSKFKKTHDITNIKASLDVKTSPDGKRGALTVNNAWKWADVLDMDVYVEFRDKKDSQEPTFKVFKYDSSEGYSEEDVDL